MGPQLTVLQLDHGRFHPSSPAQHPSPPSIIHSLDSHQPPSQTSLVSPQILPTPQPGPYMTSLNQNFLWTPSFSSSITVSSCQECLILPPNYKPQVFYLSISCSFLPQSSLPDYISLFQWVHPLLQVLLSLTHPTCLFFYSTHWKTGPPSQRLTPVSSSISRIYSEQLFLSHDPSYLFPHLNFLSTNFPL